VDTASASGELICRAGRGVAGVASGSSGWSSPSSGLIGVLIEELPSVNSERNLIELWRPPASG
jgi:hypothetical protein